MKVKQCIVNITPVTSKKLDKLQAYFLVSEKKRSRADIVDEALTLFANTKGVSLQ